MWVEVQTMLTTKGRRNLTANKTADIFFEGAFRQKMAIAREPGHRIDGCPLAAYRFGAAQVRKCQWQETSYRRRDRS
jgi:hypothetical protein